MKTKNSKSEKSLTKKTTKVMPAKPAKKLAKKAEVKKKLIKKASKKIEVTKPAKKLAKKAVESKSKSVKFQAHSTSLKPGDKAPQFEGLNQNAEKISLSDYKGKRLILYFYPKDNTPGCTTQACNLQDNLNQLKREGYEVLGVSSDDVSSHKKFAEKYKLTFNLLADIEKKAVKAYDVFGKKMFMGRIFDGIIRTSFIIGKDGFIEHVITGVNVADHSDQIRKLN